jgi:uncharacterized phiE125 gp8 family phage protein
MDGWWTAIGYDGWRRRVHARLRIVTPPSVQAVTLTQTKAHIRVEDTDSDALISAYIDAATQSLAYLGQAILPVTYALDLDYLPDRIELPKPPLVEVTSIAIIDPTGTPGTVDPSLYKVNISSEGFGEVALAYGQSWPQIRGDLGSATITFEAGYATVPNAIQIAIMMIVGQLFDNRADIGPAMQYAIPRGIDMMLQPYRVRTVV